MSNKYMPGVYCKVRQSDIDCFMVENYFNEVLRMARDISCHNSFSYSIDTDSRYANVLVIINIFDVQCSKGSEFAFKNYLTSIIKKARDEMVYRGLPYNVDVSINFCVPVKCDVKIKVNYKEVDNMLSVPEVKEIIHNISKKKGEVFTVVWADNTETSVKLMEGDTSDEYVAFMYCVSIKMFGSKGDCKKYVKEKKQVFSDRIERRSQELKSNRERKKLEQISKKEVPYAGGLIVPQLSASSMFKKNGGR